MPDLSFRQVLAPFTMLLCAAAAPCIAASSAASSASTSLQASSGGISTSIEKSSDSSSKDKKVAEGDYRIIDIAAVAERPGTLRLKLRLLAAAPGADGEFFLLLPTAVADEARLAEGTVVTARHRPYGLEFAQGEPRQAFFLALSDDWIRELQTTAVAL